MDTSKASYPHAEDPSGLLDWLNQTGPGCSLAIGATCGCDISKLGRDVCNWINGPDLPAGGICRVFDREEIRHLAGDPYWRHSIQAAARRCGVDFEASCDYEGVIRALAALGGAILPGEWALEATADLDNVLRVGLAHCERCSPESLLHLDPAGFSCEGLATVIGKRFLSWIEDHKNGRKRRIPTRSLLPVFM